jgi:hypothetical protein
MSNCRFQDSFRVASDAMRALKINNQCAEGERDDSPQAISVAYYEALAEFDKMYPPLFATEPQPKTTPPSKPKADFVVGTLVPLRPPVRCLHGIYDQTLCGHCLRKGVRVVEEISTDDDSINDDSINEVEELLPPVPTPEAGVECDDCDDVTEEIAEKAALEAAGE